MLREHSISDLLAGGLTDAEIRQRLLELTPDKLNVSNLKRCIEEVKQFCSPEYANLSSLGADAIDCSGTGGSGRARFNTSTASAFVLAAAGARVAKFGNRAATSNSGSFDLLNQLNISEKISAADAARILSAAGLVFIFAPQAYPALGAISAIRASLGSATVFNFIGPLLNPVAPSYRLMGVSNPIMQMLIAEVIKQGTGAACSLVVRSVCGLDEICPRCGTEMKEVRNGEIITRKLKATFKKGDCKHSKLQHTAQENMEIMLRIVEGDDTDSYEYELLCNNAGAGLYVCGKADSIEEGMELAQQLLRDGKVEEQVAKVKEAYAKHS